ncbi:expressed unknown protein [Seminavis robusta]|uniref:Transmembrane protein n=1 Tax=Seminavis robusta TaxID=568900 RepID=A0A9N8DUV5_9STRA|nr:expressed unknown protein [Seminavis robusta]|eukprot:Sro389_g132550.1 n/a (565) ;mRNA; f:22854-24548
MSQRPDPPNNKGSDDNMRAAASVSRGQISSQEPSHVVLAEGTRPRNTKSSQRKSQSRPTDMEELRTQARRLNEQDKLAKQRVRGTNVEDVGARRVAPVVEAPSRQPFPSAKFGRTRNQLATTARALVEEDASSPPQSSVLEIPDAPNGGAVLDQTMIHMNREGVHDAPTEVTPQQPSPNPSTTPAHDNTGNIDHPPVEAHLVQARLVTQHDDPEQQRGNDISIQEAQIVEEQKNFCVPRGTGSKIFCIAILVIVVAAGIAVLAIFCSGGSCSAGGSSTTQSPATMPFPTVTGIISPAPTAAPEPKSLQPSVSKTPTVVPSIHPTISPTVSAFPTFQTNRTVAESFEVKLSLMAPSGAGFMNASQEDEFCARMEGLTGVFAPDAVDRVVSECTFFGESSIVEPITVTLAPTHGFQRHLKMAIPELNSSRNATNAAMYHRRNATRAQKLKRWMRKSNNATKTNLPHFLAPVQGQNRRAQEWLDGSIKQTYIYPFRMKYSSATEDVANFTSMFLYSLIDSAAWFNAMLTEILHLNATNELQIQEVQSFLILSSAPTFLPTLEPTQEQ